MILLFIVTGLIFSVKAGNFNLEINAVIVQIISNETLIISYCDVFPKENITCIKKITLCLDESCESTEDGELSMKKAVINLKTINISSTINVHNETLVQFSDIMVPEKYILDKSTQFTLTDRNIVLKINLSITCQTNYLSPKCHEFDVCKSLPSDMCQNNGNCVQTDYQISCNCQQNYTGKFCQDSKDPCQDNLCGNNSTCLINQQSPLRYICNCQPGYSGIFCTNDINECLNHTICSHLPNATCYNTHGSHMCICDKSCYRKTTESPTVKTTSFLSERQKSVFIWPLNGLNTLLIVILEAIVIIMLILVLIFIQIKHYPLKKKKTNYFVDEDYLQYSKRNKPQKDRITLESNYARQPIIPEENRISLTPIFDSSEHDQSFNDHLNDNTAGMSTFGRR